MLVNELFKESYEIETIKDGVVNWTVSSLSDYLYCPYLFKIKRISKSGEFKTYTRDTLPSSNESIEIGLVFHEVLKLLLEYREYNKLERVVDMYFQTKVSSGDKNVVSRETLAKLVNYAIDLYLHIQENYDDILKVEPVVIYGDIQNNYSIKLSPDIVTSNKIIEIKTTSSIQYYEKGYIPYKYKVQKSLYSEYIGKDVDMLLVDLKDGRIHNLTVTNIERIREKVEYSTRDLLKGIFDPITDLFPDRCNRCYFKEKCSKIQVGGKSNE